MKGQNPQYWDTVFLLPGHGRKGLVDSVDIVILVPLKKDVWITGYQGKTKIIMLLTSMTSLSIRLQSSANTVAPGLFNL